MQKLPLLGGLTASLLLVAASSFAAGPYRALKSIPLPTAGGWDYLSVDPLAHRLYVAHGNEIAVIDTTKDEVVGTIADTPGSHGVAIAPDRLFVSAGRANQVKIVDPATLKTLSAVATGKNPDAILYESATHEVYAFNGRDQSATVIAADTGAVVATIALGGKPEFAQADPAAGLVYDCIEDKSEIAAIDAKTHAVVARWPIAPGEGPSGLAIDPVHHRLFAATDEMMVILDSQSGKVVGTVPAGGGVDAAAFDPGTGLAFVSCGASGTVQIVHEDDADHFTLVQTLPTAKSARTMQVDPSSHKIYLAAADFEPIPAGSPPKTRAKMVAGSLRILVFGLDR